MKRICMILLCIFTVMALSSFKKEELKTAESPATYSIQTYFEKQMKSSMLDTASWNKIRQNITNTTKINGTKWREFMIEHRYVVQIDTDSLEFVFDQVLNLDSSFRSPDGLGQIQITTTSVFTDTILISTTEDVKVAGESTVGAGLEVPGFSFSTDKKALVEKSLSQRREYSSSFSNSYTYTLVYNPSEIDVPENSTFALASIGDYFRFKAKIYEEKYYWWGTYVDAGPWEVESRIYTFHYYSYAFSDGTHLSKPTRPYLF